jgi:hypothetical protein
LTRKRTLVIAEEFGVYKVTHEKGAATGGTLEHALIRAVQQADIGGVPLDVTFRAAEVLDSLLGERREESELVTS